MSNPIQYQLRRSLRSDSAEPSYFFFDDDHKRKPRDPERQGVVRKNRSINLNTFSIVAYDATSGMLGVAVSTRVPAVGATCPFARAGVGAISTQAWTNPPPGGRWPGPAGARLQRRSGPAEALGRGPRSGVEADHRRGQGGTLGGPHGLRDGSLERAPHGRRLRGGRQHAGRRGNHNGDDRSLRSQQR